MVMGRLLYSSAGALLARALNVSIGSAQLLCKQTTIFSFTRSAQETAPKNFMNGLFPRQDHKEGSSLILSFYLLFSLLCYSG